MQNATNKRVDKGKQIKVITGKDDSLWKRETNEIAEQYHTQQETCDERDCCGEKFEKKTARNMKN